MGLFDFMKPRVSHSIDYSNVQNQGLRAVASRIRKSKDDTVYVYTSRLCPVCSMYNRRIYTLYGRTPAFPLLPTDLHAEKCKVCGCFIGYSHYFPGINGNLQEDIAFSNRPFEDSRTQEEIGLWEIKLQEKQFNAKMEKDYAWIFENLPALCPKSVGGYKRMAKANSTNYQAIVAAAKDKGYLI